MGTRKKNKFTILLFILTIGVQLLGQDVHYSQVTSFPLLLNPALSGMFQGKNRAVFAFRNQNISIPNSAFSGVYNTFGASFETKILEEQSDQNAITVGGMALSDYAGTGTLATNQVVLSGSYSLSMDRYGRSFLNIGGQAGLISRRIFSKDLLFESQIREFDFDPKLPNLESFLDGSSQIQPVFNLGVAYQQNISDQAMGVIGFSIYNLFRPDDFFVSTSTENNFSRMNLNAGVAFELDETSKLFPSLVYMKQGSFSQLNAGVSYMKEINDIVSLTGAIRTRINDAYIFSAGLKYKNLLTTVSYDLTTSSLSRSNNSVGALELNLTYIWGDDKAGYGSDKQYCPAY